MELPKIGRKGSASSVSPKDNERRSSWHTSASTGNLVESSYEHQNNDNDYLGASVKESLKDATSSVKLGSGDKSRKDKPKFVGPLGPSVGRREWLQKQKEYSESISILKKGKRGSIGSGLTSSTSLNTKKIIPVKPSLIEDSERERIITILARYVRELGVDIFLSSATWVSPTDAGAPTDTGASSSTTPPLSSSDNRELTVWQQLDQALREDNGGDKQDDEDSIASKEKEVSPKHAVPTNSLASLEDGSTLSDDEAERNERKDSVAERKEAAVLTRLEGVLRKASLDVVIDDLTLLFERTCEMRMLILGRRLQTLEDENMLLREELEFRDAQLAQSMSSAKKTAAEELEKQSKSDLEKVTAELKEKHRKEMEDLHSRMSVEAVIHFKDSVEAIRNEAETRKKDLERKYHEAMTRKNAEIEKWKEKVQDTIKETEEKMEMKLNLEIEAKVEAKVEVAVNSLREKIQKQREEMANYQNIIKQQEASISTYCNMLSDMDVVKRKEEVLKIQNDTEKKELKMRIEQLEKEAERLGKIASGVG